MKISGIFFLGVLIVLNSALISSCNSKRKKETQARQNAGERPPANVDVFIVKSTTLSESIELPGTIVADESTEIHPEISGRITNIYVREGAYVNKGAVLAKLYDADLQAQKRKIQVQLQIAKQTANRYQQLQEIGGISKQDYDLTVLEVSNLNADLDIINTNIAKTVIRAPFSGKMGLREVSTGAFVTPASVITSIQKTRGLRLDFNVPEKYSGQIYKGQYVNFTVAGSSRAYTAVVMATESGISEDTRSLTIRALVKGEEDGLVPGGFARVKVSFEPDTSALMVPSQAIIPEARGKKVYVYRNGIAEYTDVVTGVRDSAMVHVTDGLSNGDTVITTGLLGLKPDVKVTVKNIIN